MIGTQIKIAGTEEYKTISEIETISGVDIFYMSDNTSYPYHKLIFTQKILDQLKKYKYERKLGFDVDKCNESLGTCMDNFAFHFVKALESVRDQKKTTTKQFKIFGWTITFTKSK